MVLKAMLIVYSGFVVLNFLGYAMKKRGYQSHSRAYCDDDGERWISSNSAVYAYNGSDNAANDCGTESTGDTCSSDSSDSSCSSND